jgi:hypothetical protein
MSVDKVLQCCRSCTKLAAEDIVGIARACRHLRFLNLDGCQVPGSCVARVLAARPGIRFCHQLASLADEGEESPMWRDPQARRAAPRARCIPLTLSRGPAPGGRVSAARLAGRRTGMRSAISRFASRQLA